jgi:hypothetical protein
MPDGFDHLNWNVVLWGVVWPPFHGLWSWFWVLTAIRLALIFFLPAVAAAAAQASKNSVAVVAAVYMTGALATWLPQFWLGFVANRGVWERWRTHIPPPATTTASGDMAEKTPEPNHTMDATSPSARATAPDDES